MVTETERQSLIGDKDRDSHCVVTETAARQSLGVTETAERQSLRGDRDRETVTE